MWDDSSRITMMFFKAIFGIFAFIWNSIVGCINKLLSMLNLKQLKNNNADKRGVEERRTPQAVSELLKDITAGGKVIVSGNDYESPSPWRNVITARTAAQIMRKGVGVVVLHCGDEDLTARLQSLIDSSKLIIADTDNQVYDPLCDLNPSEYVKVLSSNCDTDGNSLSEDAKSYLEGLVLCGKYCRKKMPSLNMIKRLVNVDLDSLQRQLLENVERGKITPEQQRECNALLVGGVSGRMKLRWHINTLCEQLGDVLATGTTVDDRKLFNMKRALNKGCALVIDAQNISDYRLGYGVLMNELDRALSGGKRGYLVIDNLEISACSGLYKKVTAKDSRLGVCVSVDDLFAKCESKQEKLNTTISSSECCFTFNHASGDSAEAWQKKFGMYEKIEITYNETEGRMKPNPFTLFSGSNSNKGRAYTPKMEPRVKAEQIQNLPQGVVYVTAKGKERILHCPLEEA